jgi:amino-acid N-acetyltransferase
MTGTARTTLRPGAPGDARRLHALIAANQLEGHLLPRTLADVAQHAERFVVAVRSRKIVGCADLAALSPQIAEVRSLAVDPSARHRGVGTMIVDALRARARREGFDRLCAFTHVPGYFTPMGFSIVPHLWLTEKVYMDCVKCPLFRRCGQYAMVLPLEAATEAADARDPIMVARHA